MTEMENDSLVEYIQTTCRN